MFRKKKNPAPGNITSAGPARPADPTDVPLAHWLSDLHDVLTDIRDDLRTIRDHLEDDRQLSEIATTLDAVRDRLDDQATDLIGRE
ncbi:hypothetical protein [Nocardia carnea]|uniref:hypothetical protein n=1 Tax=Nocardia carnea TaxID=37328 RepID=UPI0024575FA8|nr:hypothetical protein [Nocardia carnea]